MIDNIASVKNRDFLRRLDLENLKTTYVKITVMTMAEEPVQSIEGKITTGSINIAANSAVRRTCNLTFLANEDDYAYNDLSSLLAMNKKIQVSIGVENNIDRNFPDIIWFKQGIFVIINVSITSNEQGIQISLQCKDKMCLLNGECGGGLPTSITFHMYDQLDKEGNRIEVPQLIYDIIQTLVCNWGGENESNVFINDVPKRIKNILRFVGDEQLYFNTETKQYSLDAPTEDVGKWRIFNFNDDVGYTYVDFVYPGELISNIGDNVCSVLDTIVATLGNFEYFYDVDGHFVFQEIKNYLNNSYNPSKSTYIGYQINQENGNLCMIDEDNYLVDFNSNTKSEYEFSEGNGLISSYSNTPNYANMKNDYHIWGKKNNLAIHYHLAIKSKPTVFNNYLVNFLQDEDERYNGRISYLGEPSISDLDFSMELDEETGDYILIVPDSKNYSVKQDKSGEYILVCTKDAKYESPETLVLTNSVSENTYIPSDWRAELYLRGLKKQAEQKRPDIYEQELLDNFDSIYNFYEPWRDENGNYIYWTDKDGNYILDINGNKIVKRGLFKTDIINRPNNLNYFMDFLEPYDKYEDCSVDAINMRIYSYQEDKIVKLYNTDIPNIIIINRGASSEEEIKEQEKVRKQCDAEGQTYSNVDRQIYNLLAQNTLGYTAQETVRELLYQYTNFNENISLSTIPIYYLDVNSRITVQDKGSNIYGDYIIKSISVPLNVNGQMSISATKALERI